MIGRKSFLVYFNQVFGAVTGIIGMFFIARFMANPDFNYGIVNFALGFAGMFGFIGNLFGKAHVKRMSEGLDEGQCMGTFVSLQTLTVAIMLGISFGSIMIWKYGLGRGFETPAHETVLYIILSFVAIKALGNIGVKTFQAKGEIAKREIARFMDYNVPTIFIIIVSLTGGQAIELAYTYLTGALLMSLVAIYFMKNIEIKKPDFLLAKSYFVFALPFFISSITSKLGKQLDTVMVQAFWSSSNVGYYAVSLRFAAMVTGISTAVVTVLFPKISNHHSQNDWHSIKELTISSTRYLSMIVVPLVFLLIILPEEIIIILLSARFLPATRVMQVMALSSFFIVLSGPLISVLGGIDRPLMTAKITISSNLLNFALNIILIPASLFGVSLLGLKELGAAIATLSASIFLFVFISIYAKRESGAVVYKGIPVHIFSGISAGLIVLILKYNVMEIVRFYHLGFYGLLFMGLYSLFLFIVGELTKDDIDYFLENLHILSIYKYIKEELK